MKRNEISSEMKVGILVLVSIVILFYMSFRIGKFGVLQERGYDLTVLFENVAGLGNKSPVQIAGVEVGFGLGTAVAVTNGVGGKDVAVASGVAVASSKRA